MNSTKKLTKHLSEYKFKLFYIHNNLSLIFLDLLLQKLEVDREDIILLVDNRMKGKFENIHNLKIIDSFNWNRELKFMEFAKAIEEIDNILQQNLANDKFTLFLPHTKRLVFSALATSKLCVGYYIYEEGIGAYHHVIKNKVRFKKLKHFLFKRAYYFTKFYSEETNFLGYLCLNKYAFPTSKNKFILEVSGDDSYFKNNSSDLHIVILDALLEHNRISEKIFFDGINSLINFINKKSVKSIYIKFHPAQFEHIKFKVVSLFEMCEINVVVVSDKIILEKAIFNSSSQYKMVFYGFISSLLLYASISDNDVYSFSKQILKNSPNPILKAANSMKLSIRFE